MLLSLPLTAGRTPLSGFSSVRLPVASLPERPRLGATAAVATLSLPAKLPSSEAKRSEPPLEGAPQAKDRAALVGSISTTTGRAAVPARVLAVIR